MGIPVVVAGNGYGTPVTIATNGYGLPVEVAANGYGMPVVLVASGGLPVNGTFGPDVTAPLAVSFSPTDNSTGVNTATLLIVTFDSVVTLGTGNVTLKKTSDNSTVEAWNVATEAGTGAGQVSVEFSTQLTMRLTASIAGGTEYYVIWDANVVKDIANNPVAANASTTLWSFTTAGSAYDAATEAIAAAFTTPPTTARKNLIDAAVVALKAAGVWTKLDALYLFAAADRQAAIINWKQPGTYNCTEVSSPTFTADQGFTGASTKYLDSGFNPTTAPSPKYVQNAASGFGWSLTVASVNGVWLGNDGDGRVVVAPNYGGTCYIGLNAGGDPAIANPFSDGSGLWVASRISSNSNETYRNGGANFFAHSTASVAPHNSTLKFLTRSPGNQHFTGQLAAGGIGTTLTAADNTALYNALRTYMLGLTTVANTETTAIISAFTNPPTPARTTLIDNCVGALKTAGVWTKLDALYLFAAADRQAAIINWKQPGTYNCTEVSSPTFAVDLGFTSASTKYIDTSFNPTTAPTPKYVLNDASLAVWGVTNVDNANYAIYQSGNTQFVPRTANTYYAVIHGGAFVSAASADSTGLWVATRTSSTSVSAYRNASLLNTNAALASVAQTSVNVFFANGWTGQTGAGAIASQLSAADNTALYNALRTYMTGVGMP